MIRTASLVLIGMLGMSCSSAFAADDTPPLITGRSVSCDKEAPVCAVMDKGRLVPYASECQARQDGAARVIFGDCYDED